MLALANDFLSRFNTPSIQEDPALWKPALERVVLYIALAPYGKDQQQLLNRVYKEPKLVSILFSMMKCLYAKYFTNMILRGIN